MSPLRRLLLIFALTACWSPSFLFIKLAVSDLPPFTIVAMRVFMAATILCGILLWKRRPLPVKPLFWVHSLVMALFASVFPFCLFCYAEESIESSMAAILNGASPMFTALLAHAFLPNDKLRPQKVVGIGLSAAGILLLFAPNLQQGISGTTMSILAGTTAAFCYAVSHVYGKKYCSGQTPFLVPTAQLLCATMILVPVAFFYDDPLNLPMPSFQSLAGVAGLSIFGTVSAFIIYYKLLDHCGPTAISMVASFFPVGGMLLGFTFLGETLTWGALGASSVILVGLVVVNEVVDLKPALARLLPAEE